MCPRSPASQSYLGLHHRKHGQKVEGEDSAPLLCSGGTPPGVLRPPLEPSAQERHGVVGAGPEEAANMVRWLEHFSCEERLSWGGSAWGTKGSGRTLFQPFSIERGTITKRRTGF